MRLWATSAIAWAVAAHPACAADGPRSTASVLTAVFRAHGQATRLGPVATIAGASSPVYDSAAELIDLVDSVAIVADAPTPVLRVSGHGLQSHVSSSSGGGMFRMTMGADSVGEARLTLAPDGAAAALTIEVRELVSSVYSKTGPGKRTSTMGLTSVGALVISGPLVGGATLRYSGQVRPNTVLFKSSAVTITLNRQTVSEADDCDSDCPAGAGGPVNHAHGVIGVIGVDAELRDAVIGVTKVRGHIRINQAMAR